MVIVTATTARALLIVVVMVLVAMALIVVVVVVLVAMTFLIVVVVMLVAMTFLVVVVVVLVAMALLVVVVVVMVVLVLLFKRLYCVGKSIALFHSCKNILAVKLVPRSGNDSGRRVVLTKKRNALGNLMILCSLGMRKNDC